MVRVHFMIIFKSFEYFSFHSIKELQRTVALTDNVNIMRHFLWQIALFLSPDNIVLIIMEEHGHKTSLASPLTDKRSIQPTVREGKHVTSQQ